MCRAPGRRTFAQNLTDDSAMRRRSKKRNQRCYRIRVRQTSRRRLRRQPMAHSLRHDYTHRLSPRQYVGLLRHDKAPAPALACWISMTTRCTAAFCLNVRATRAPSRPKASAAARRIQEEALVTSTVLPCNPVSASYVPCDCTRRTWRSG